MKVTAIIPSRFESKRFPGKALADIQGKTMIQRVYEQVQKSSLIDKVYVATDSDAICTSIGMTPAMVLEIVSNWTKNSKRG